MSLKNVYIKAQFLVKLYGSVVAIYGVGVVFRVSVNMCQVQRRIGNKIISALFARNPFPFAQRELHVVYCLPKVSSLLIYQAHKSERAALEHGHSRLGYQLQSLLLKIRCRGG